MKLSIITINYNDAIGLKRTIESIINQTYKDFEFIIIDGGSTDGSKELIEQHKDVVSYWISEPDKGVYNAMNKGIKKAIGEYVIFMNGGDHFFENCSLEKAIAHIKNTDVIYFDWQWIDENPRFSNYPAHLSFFAFCKEGLPHQATFIKTELFKLYGLYDENLKLVSDWKFFLALFFKYGCTYKKVNEVITCYYADGISSISNQKPERTQVLNELFPNFKKDIEDYYKNIEIVKYVHNSKRVKLLNKFGIIKIDI